MTKALTGPRPTRLLDDRLAAQPGGHIRRFAPGVLTLIEDGEDATAALTYQGPDDHHERWRWQRRNAPSQNGYYGDNLDILWRTVRAPLALLAEGATQNLDGDRVSESKDPSRRPPASGGELRHLERRWGGCRGKGDRKRVVVDAIRLLRLSTVPKTHPHLIPGTQEWRERIARDPRSSRVVANEFGISHRTVLDYREKIVRSGK